MEGIQQAREALRRRATITTTNKVMTTSKVSPAPGVTSPGKSVTISEMITPSAAPVTGAAIAMPAPSSTGVAVSMPTTSNTGVAVSMPTASHAGVTVSMPAAPCERTAASQRAASRQTDLIPYKRLFLRIASECTQGRFRIDDQNREIIRSLFLYFLGQPGPLDPRKGLWLSGPIGTGKSTLMFVFSQFMRALGEGFRVHVCSEVTTFFSLSGDLDKYLSNRNGFLGTPVALCFDELGREPIPAKYFGTELNVMQHLLHIRYSYWQTEGLKTYVTTNLFPNEVEWKYGDYIRDRRKEMFNLIKLDGTSRR